MKKLSLVLGSILGVVASMAFVASASVATINAGADQSITWPASSVTLTGSATASDGKSIASYGWVQTSGPVSSTVVSPAVASTSVTGLSTPGTYVYTLTATDNSTPAESATDTVSVVVNPGITVSAGSNQTITLPTSTATLTGTASTSPGNSIATYSWVQTSGPVSATIASPASASTGISGLTSTGSYVFTLTATNNGSPVLTGTSTVTITVNPAGTTPAPKPIKSKLEIGPYGRVEMRGELLSKGTNVLTIKVWGITFTVNTAGARFIGAISDVNQYVVGDVIEVKGIMDTNATTPTLNAKQVKDLTLQAKKEMDWREKIRLEQEKLKQLKQEIKEKKKEIRQEWKEEKKEWKQGKKNGWDD